MVDNNKEVNDKFLIVRVPSFLKADIVAEAKRLGQSLSEYVRRILKKRDDGQ